MPASFVFQAPRRGVNSPPSTSTGNTGIRASPPLCAGRLTRRELTSVHRNRNRRRSSLGDRLRRKVVESEEPAGAHSGADFRGRRATTLAVRLLDGRVCAPPRSAHLLGPVELAVLDPIAIA